MASPALQAMTRPPNDRGQGRKPLSAAEPTVSMTMRMPLSLRGKVERIGGAERVRQLIAAEPEPKRKAKEK
jgi:hypothetical protein